MANGTTLDLLTSLHFLQGICLNTAHAIYIKNALTKEEELTHCSGTDIVSDINVKSRIS